MTDSSTLALLGGPESGKTTYLGAIVDALQAGRLPGLQLRVLPTDARAYDQLAAPLLEGRYPQRTKAERHTLELLLRAGRDGKIRDFTLTMGDYDGEEVERLFTHRTSGFSPEWRARAMASGLLLFVRPDALTPLPELRRKQAMTDETRWQALRSEGSDAIAAARPGSPQPAPARPEQVFGPGLADEPMTPPPAAPDDPVRIPTALAIIELLQFLRHVRGLAPGERPPPGTLRVAMLATAWDAVDPDFRTRGPRAFLLDQAPLLDDFLWSNFHDEDVAWFGLSSTAGNLRDPRYQERYLDDMHGFVEWTDVTGTVKQTRNIAVPFAWLLAGERALAETSSDQS